VTELSALDTWRSARICRTRLGSIDWPAQERTAHALIGRFGVDIDVHRPLMYATPVERTIVAIAAALEGWEGGRGVLVLDEPTAVLPHTEVDKLLEIVREVRPQRHERPLRLAPDERDLRHRRSRHRPARRPAHRHARRRRPHAPDPRHDDGRRGRRHLGPARSGERRRATPCSRSATCAQGVLRGISFELRKGELLGIAGLPGSGRETLPYAIAGAWEGSVSGALRLPAQSGDWIDLGDDEAPRFPLVPANRTAEGVISAFSVKENLTLR